MKNLKTLSPLLFLLLVGAPALAQTSPPAFELGVSSVVDVEFTGSDASSFDLDSARAAVELYGFTLSAEVYDFTWDGAEELGFANGSAEPWGQLKVASLRRTDTRPLGGAWLLTTSLGVGLAFEEEAEDSYFADVLAAVIWNRSEDWSFLFGIGYSWHSKVEVEYEIIPALGFTYRGRAERGFSASLGLPETGVRYRFSGRSAVSLGAGVRTFVGRLADDSAVVAAGYSELIQFDLGLYYELRLGDRFELRAGPTYGFEGELKIHDADGVLLGTRDLEPAPGFNVELKLTF